MTKALKYNLGYIGGIVEYRKRAMYTLSINDTFFSVDGLFKSQVFKYDDIVDIRYGLIDGLKDQFEIIQTMIYSNASWMDWKSNKQIKYGLVIFMKDTTIVFAEEYEVSIANAYKNLLTAVNKTRKKADV